MDDFTYGAEPSLAPRSSLRLILIVSTLNLRSSVVIQCAFFRGCHNSGCQAAPAAGVEDAEYLKDILAYGQCRAMAYSQAQSIKRIIAVKLQCRSASHTDPMRHALQ
eukprot:1463208-Amphidinium_carterae.1